MRKLLRIPAIAPAGFSPRAALRIVQSRRLLGPNVYSRLPVHEYRLEVEASAEGEPSSILPRVLAAVEGGLPWEDGAERAASSWGEAWAGVVIRLQQRVQVPASFCLALPGASADEQRVVVESVIPALTDYAAEVALRLFHAARRGEVELTAEELERLKGLEYEARWPISTAEIVHAARRRGIPVRALSPSYQRLLVLGQGSKQRRTYASEPDSISAVSRLVTTDKALAKELLSAVGVPVPPGRVVSSAEQAWQAAQELGLPVVVKPLSADLQVGVSLHLRTQQQVEAAYEHAVREHGRAEALVERCIPGREYRLLMVDGRAVAATRMDPPEGNPSSVNALSSASANPAAHPSTIAPGDRFIDQTDEIHPSIIAHAAAACEAVQAPIAGLDIVVQDIREPLESQGGAVIEVNVGPGLWVHLPPANEHPRLVGEAIVRSLFPPGEDGRVPVVAVVGREADLRPLRLHLPRVLALTGQRVGYAGLATTTVAGRTWPSPQNPHPRAQQLLQHTAIDLAIVETTPEELIQQAWGNDRCDLALVAASQADDPGWSTAPVCCLKALRHALSPGGTLIAPAQLHRLAIDAGFQPEELILLVPRSQLDRQRRALSVEPDGRIWLADRQAFLRVFGRLPPSLRPEEVPAFLMALAAGIAFNLTDAHLRGTVLD